MNNPDPRLGYGLGARADKQFEKELMWALQQTWQTEPIRTEPARAAVMRNGGVVPGPQTTRAQMPSGVAPSRSPRGAPHLQERGNTRVSHDPYRATSNNVENTIATGGPVIDVPHQPTVEPMATGAQYGAPTYEQWSQNRPIPQAQPQGQAQAAAYGFEMPKPGYAPSADLLAKTLGSRLPQMRGMAAPTNELSPFARNGMGARNPQGIMQDGVVHLPEVEVTAPRYVPETTADKYAYWDDPVNNRIPTRTTGDRVGQFAGLANTTSAQAPAFAGRPEWLTRLFAYLTSIQGPQNASAWDLYNPYNNVGYRR